jgi:hypothetical protein
VYVAVEGLIAMRILEPGRLQSGPLRRVALAAFALCAALALTSASAQSADSGADPPGRVGRLSYLSGPVQLVDAGAGASEDATLNWPITSGMRLVTGPLGRAEVQIGSLVLRVDGDSEVEFTRVDDEAIQLEALRGTLALNVRNRDLLRDLDVLTPRERIVIEDIGRYRVDVDRVAATTSLTVRQGQARILSGRLIFTVASGQRGDLESAPVSGFRLGVPLYDPFDEWVAARERRDDAPRSAQYVSPEMTGMEALDDNGTWQPVESYGPVWFPSYAPAGWAPYRYGRWAYIAPWGWTWIDDAPWGFAPFHYGRWVVINGVWGWAPGVIVPRPVYAPALVVWLGSPGVSVSIGIGAPIGWFPLGPREVFIPPYRCSRRYVNFVNVPQVTNITNITVINPPSHYINLDRNRTTWVPGNAFFHRGPIQRVVVPPPTDWRGHAPSMRPPIEAPRDIKKRPTPVPMPGREPRFDRTPPTPHSVSPPRGAAPAPGVTARPAPRGEEPRGREPRPGRPEAPGARTPAPHVSAPAPSVPPAPRVAPPEERRQPVPRGEDSERKFKPSPMPLPRQEITESVPRAQERERGPRRAVPQPVPRPAPPAVPVAPQVAPPAVPPVPRGNQGRGQEPRGAPEERVRVQPERGNRAAQRTLQRE